MAVDTETKQMEDVMGDLFDHIEDLLDFPGDEDALGLVDPCGKFPPIPASVADEILGGVGGDSLDGFGAQNNKPNGAAAAFSPEEDKLGPCDELDIVQLEWMSKFLDESDSFDLDIPSGDAVVNVDDNRDQAKANEQCFFRTSSPVSVLEANNNGGGGGSSGSDSSSSSSSSSSSTSASYFIGGNKDGRVLLPPLSPPEPPSALVVPARARSKRPRPAAFSPRPHVAIPYLPPSSDVVTVPNPLSASAAAAAIAANSDPESFGESCPPPPPPKKKKSKKKSPAAAGGGEEIGSAPPVRKCMHCEIQKTPQWRAGPMGPKTLCNACGVRYKSGRLFPEYRPAASPTFVPSIHSNSHKKVVEMRNKTSEKNTDGCDLLEFIRRRE
ncbi:hypothetical protein Cni_G26868 [Canna indica]|uniref:GATA-type domain-containing protein n=1 Tax=Canna indica TaxID=4628 RepID=A0AAQ3QRP0_9LILI|nr:hypothetical protein Cni_G26868 [Canna indica]